MTKITFLLFKSEKDVFIQNSLVFLGVGQTTDGRSNGGSRGCCINIGTTGHCFLASLATPDTDTCSLHGVLETKKRKQTTLRRFTDTKNSYLSTEGARVFGVLGDFHLFDHFTEGSTISSSVLSCDSDFLGTFGLRKQLIIARKKHELLKNSTRTSVKHTILKVFG